MALSKPLDRPAYSGRSGQRHSGAESQEVLQMTNIQDCNEDALRGETLGAVHHSTDLPNGSARSLASLITPAATPT